MYSLFNEKRVKVKQNFKKTVKKRLKGIKTGFFGWARLDRLNIHFIGLLALGRALLSIEVSLGWFWGSIVYPDHRRGKFEVFVFRSLRRN